MAVNNVNYNDTLREGTDKINQSIDQSNNAIQKATDADSKADNAVQTANLANTKSDSTQAQLDTIIIENGQSDAEVLQARTDAQANTFSTLQQRLNASDELLAQNENRIGIKNYASGEGIETVNLQLAINENVGSIIVLSPNHTYTIDDVLNLPDNTHIYAYGAKIKRNTQGTIFECGNNVVIEGLTLESTNSFNYNDRAISMVGVYDNYKENLLVKDCTIKNFGGFGIRLNYARNIDILDCNIDGIGYAGVQTFSASNVVVDGGSIKNIGSSQEQLSYGVTFSRSGLDNSLTIYPRSKDCVARNILIENVSNWEGLDTHGGENIEFSNNTIRGCKTGIAVVSSHLNGVGDHSPINVRISNNTIYGIEEGAGITVSGANATNGNYGEQINIVNNTLINCGETDDMFRGAIRSHTTLGLLVSNNTLIRSIEGGINIYTNNKGCNINGNTIIDTQSSGYAGAYGIGVTQDEQNTGVIEGNSILLEQDSLNTYVMERGIYLNGDNSNVFNIGMNYNTAKTKLWGTNNMFSLENEIIPLKENAVEELSYSGVFKYVKYANGLVLQWGTANIDATVSESQEFILPIPLTQVGSGSITLNSSGSYPNLTDYKNMGFFMTSTAWNVRMLETSTNTSVPITLMCIGRWK